MRNLAFGNLDKFKGVLSWSSENWIKKIKGLIFIALGYLLSPLCWWNDLFFNLPLAYGIGYLCSWINPQLFIPGTIAGYWLSNVVGILLMQAGAIDVFEEQKKEKNLKKELLSGLLSSTVYTLIIIALVQFNLLNLPDLGNPQELFGSFLPKNSIE